MTKALCILGMVISILVIALFGLDIATQFPFRGVGMAWSIIFIIGAAIVTFLSWSALRSETK